MATNSRLWDKLSSGLWNNESLEKIRDAYLAELGFTVGPAWVGVAYQGAEIVRRKVVFPVQVVPAGIRWTPVRFELPPEVPVGVTVDVIAAGKPAEVFHVARCSTALVTKVGDTVDAGLAITVGDPREVFQ